MREYPFSFHPDTGRVPRIEWKRLAADMYDAHNEATAAALREYPRAHGFLTVSPEYLERHAP